MHPCFHVVFLFLFGPKHSQRAMNFSNSADVSAASPTTSLGIGGTGANQIAAAFTTWTIAATFVCLRMWTRVRIVRAVRLCDWIIVLSAVAAFGQCISKIGECIHGAGKHIQEIDFAAESFGMLQAWWFTLLTYQFTLALTKISISSFYLTIFTLHWERRASIAVLVLVVTASLWSIICVATAAIPLRALWDINIKATFMQSDRAWWSLAGLNIGTDLVIFTLPIPIVARLRLPPRQNVLVVCTFAIGFFVCVVSFIRLGILIQSARVPDPDWTYNGANLTYWTLIEGNTGITVACIMTLKPLVSKLFPNLLEPSGITDSGRNNTGFVSSSERPLTVGSRPARVLFNATWTSSGSVRDDNITLQDLERRKSAADKLGDGSVTVLDR
ncbi:hypothetical protein B0H67DRAFT_595669 [Lasiosphaeris hirsuta]|uniref:Rhodopsin domain-containing protein n=1 Tax=Lasiosphaeris hirsuta TaxID=260670 RepID=A0AA40DH65_9PEZI|nr:hypothetical protein B0H67DRAFT_595669 [Lasiosphaeris hirsuta]